MLQDRYRQLLTAYVDGELSSRQRRHVARLLRRSPDARELLRKLQADSHVLRHLPRPALPADLAEPVLHTIAERRLKPSQRRIATHSSPSSWVAPLAPWAAAASVLLILGMASYLYFAVSLTQPANSEMAKKDLSPPASPGNPPPRDAAQINPEQASTPPAERSHPIIDLPVAVNPPRGVQPPPDKVRPNDPDKHVTPSKHETALTDRLEMFQLDRVADLLPVIVKVSDLEQESLRKRLLAELRKESNLRVELPCPNGTKALERVERAAKALRVGLIIDKQAQERIKLKWRTSYVIYLENITPDELTSFVRQIVAEDRKITANKPTEAQLDRLILSQMTAQHHKELSTLLGIDPTTTAPSATGPLGTELHKPLTDLTAQQLGKALAGQGGPPRSEAGKPAPKPPEHVALVLAFNPVRPSPSSDEVKRFLDSRTPARPGTLRVLLLLRS
jgi:hypothetical protein